MDRSEFQDRTDPSPREIAREAYIRKLEAENSALKEQQGTDRELFAYVRDSITTYEPIPPVAYPRPRQKHDPIVAALVLTDAHAEEWVRPEEMEGLASYDFSTFEDRMDQTAAKAIELCGIMRRSSSINTLHVWCLGDWFCGEIHPEEGGYGTTMPLPCAVPRVGFRLAKVLAELAPHFGSVSVVGMCGNHGRTTVKPVNKATADRNWDMSVYLIAQEATRNLPNVTWTIPQSIMAVSDACGHNVLLSHSAKVRMQGRTPYYGIETMIASEHKSRRGTGKDFDYAFFGHWHHYAVLDGEATIAPCMIGDSQFGRYNLHRVSAAQQHLAFFTEKHGRTAQWNIELE